MFFLSRFMLYGGPEGTTLLLENVVSFCKNITVQFLRILQSFLVNLRSFFRNIAVLWKQSRASSVESSNRISLGGHWVLEPVFTKNMEPPKTSQNHILSCLHVLLDRFSCACVSYIVINRVAISTPELSSSAHD